MANNRKPDRRSRAVRVMCLVLVALMLLGTVSTVLFFLLAGASSAAEYKEPVMSIGIQYGDTAVSSYRTYSDTGYNIWSQKPDGERTSTKIGSLTDKTLIVAPHANLASSGTGYKVATTGVTVGGYRIDIAKSFTSFDSANTEANRISSALSAYAYYAFPAYIGGAYKVRIGPFLSESDASAALSTVSSAAGATASVSAPSSVAVSVLSSSGVLKYEFENSTATYLGLSPAGAGDVYLRADNNNIYEGIFMYKRGGSALTIINIIPLETYIEGVLPYEISSSWHIEAQKAFSIAARSYAVGNVGKHYNAYGFDLCSSTNCQVYKGAVGVTDTVKKAVAETRGEVLAYNGKIATLYYSSSTGGCTTSAKDCWGGTGAPYLVGVSTPWERYANYGNGLWTCEVSPSELCTYLREKGYTQLTGSIASVEIVSCADNSTYVKSLKITDTSGNSTTITNTDKVRTTLTKYLKSANFVVGRGSVTYTVSKVEAGSETIPYSSLDMSSFNVITSALTTLFNGSGKVNVATGSGNVQSTSAYESVITADNYMGGTDTITQGYTTTYETRVATASSSGNFIFAGKGWGHGVGLSQYGAKDLAEFGYTYERILSQYVPSAEIKTVGHLS